VSIKSKDYLLVSVQFLLFTLYLWNPVSAKVYNGNYLDFIAASAVLLGILIMLFAIYGLRKSISPFPSPRKDAVLIQVGIYKFVRHPIYTSILLCTFGWAIYSNSMFRMIIFVALILLFEIKSNFEETLLTKRFKDYINYKKVTGKYLPKIN
jgi:protein-S-isoprenylcysteine O-methyltransferase Ste14